MLFLQYKTASSTHWVDSLAARLAWRMIPL